MPRTVVSTTAAPGAIGPYSQAIRAGDFVYLSGQIPLDPASGELVAGDISAQTKRVMQNLGAVLDAAGASWSAVVKTTIYLVDLGDFAAVNAVYGGYFQTEPPARATVQVAALPRGSRVEIDAVAYVGGLAGKPAHLAQHRGQPGPRSGPNWRSMAKKDVSVHGSSFSNELLQSKAETALDAVNGVGADEQADLVDAWVAAGNIAAVARVAQEDDAPAPARKAARRGLNVLKSRGIRVPEKSNVARPLKAATERTLEARFLPTDAGGNAVISIVARTPGKETYLVDVVFSEGRGISRVSGGMLSNSRLRQWETESRRTRGYSHVEVPLEWARWRVAELRHQNARSGLLLPLELDNFSDLLLPTPAAPQPHPSLALQLDPQGEGDATARVARSIGLHDEPEFRAFLVPREAIAEVLRRVGERLVETAAQPTQEHVDPLLDQELAAAVDRFFEPEARKQLAERMLDAMLSIHRRAGVERAKDVAAARLAVLNAGLITQPPREIGFLRGFFDKTLSLLAAQSQGRLNIPMPARQQAAGQVLSADQLAAIDSARENPPEAGEAQATEGLARRGSGR
jgi:reactive intermediate/imine deaminase